MEACAVRLSGAISRYGPRRLGRRTHFRLPQLDWMWVGCVQDSAKSCEVAAEPRALAVQPIT